MTGISPLALAGAAVFFVARIVYINAVPYIRSSAWTIGFVGILMMAWPLAAKLAQGHLHGGRFAIRPSDA